MAVTRNQPIKGAPRESRVRLGQQLFRRRGELGFGDSRPRFNRATGVNKRYSDDLENARRDNFTWLALRHAAEGYAVTYESLVDVAWGKRDELTPAGPAAPAALPAPGEPPGWMAADEDRTEANRPYADRIRGRLDMLAAQGVPAPSGARLFPDSPADARDWDKYDDWEIPDRVWFIADLQRRADARGPGGVTGTDGA